MSAHDETDDGTDRDTVDISRYWEQVRPALQRDTFTRLAVLVGQTSQGLVAPPAFAFGSTPEQADEAVERVLSGRKTATSSALADYGAGTDEEVGLPRVGDLAILLDGRGHPRGVVRTTEVRVVAFDAVDEDHAWAEAEGDGRLTTWRRDREFFARAGASGAAGGAGAVSAGELPVVLERFVLAHPRLVPATDADRAPAPV